MAVNLKDIAEQARVSPATVSLVLNNKPGVKDTTRKKVLAIAKKLNYGTLRHTLGHIRKGTIRFLKIARHGHVINRDHDVFIADYIDGLDMETRIKGYNLEINAFSTGNIQEIIRSAEQAHVSGVIVLGTELSAEDIKAFEQLKIPTVFIDTYFEYLNFDFVTMNNIDSIFQMVSYLVENGHREIGFIRASTEARNFILRDIGFKMALNHLGIKFNEKYVYSVDSTFQGAYSDMLANLDRTAKLPTALVSSNDIVAYGCMKAMKERGIIVPDDVSVIGFDDLPLSAVMEPYLTTMRVSKKRIGQVSVRLMIDRLERKIPNLPPAKVIISGTLVYRSSVKKLR